MRSHFSDRKAWAIFVVSLALACGSNHDGGDGGSVTGGVANASGGQPAVNGTGGSRSGTGSVGGAQAGGGSKVGAGGSRTSTFGGAAQTAGGGATGTIGGGSTLPAGGYPAQTPPPAREDGSSPYLSECHGDTRSCVDIANLRCLGLRDGMEVAGYSCSNPCADDSDCSSADTAVSARAQCVDFVIEKHCLLVCIENDQHRDCPSGMSCYQYPGNPIGYCLWK